MDERGVYNHFITVTNLMIHECMICVKKRLEM